MLVPLPASDEFHTVENLQAKAAVIREFKDGLNRYAAYSFHEVPAGLTVEYDITIRDYFVDLEALQTIPVYKTGTNLYKTYTKKTTGQIDLDHPRIKEAANALWKESTNIIDYARKAYLYVGENTTYITGSYASIDEIYARGTDGKPAGDCGAHSILYASLLRNKGIPARLQTGYVLSDDKAWDAHMWTEFYVEDIGWVPSDPTFKSGDTYFSYTTSRRLFLNRGEELSGESDGWSYSWSDGAQLKAYRIDYSGNPPAAAVDFYINQQTSVVPLSLPDTAGYYQQPGRVNAMIDDIVRQVGAELIKKGMAAPRRSGELEKAASLKLQQDELPYNEALKSAGFSANAVYLQHWFFSIIPGQNPVDKLMRILYEGNHIDPLLSLSRIGIGYQYRQDMHDFYLISANGRKSGKIEIRLPKKNFGINEFIKIEVEMKDTIPDELDWLGLYEAGETPDGDPPSIWWDRLQTLNISTGGIYLFDPARIPDDKKQRYLKGKKYKFIIAYFDGYNIEAEAEFGVK